MMTAMGFGGILFMLFIWGIGVFILILAVRYAIDSSKTSQKLDDLVNEISLLRSEWKGTQNNSGSAFDKKI